MLIRLVSLAFAAVLLAACSDVSDDSPTPTVAPPTLAPSEPTVENTPDATATSTRTPSIIAATATPTPAPRPVDTPSGTTGLNGVSGDSRLDQACVDALDDNDASPPASEVTTSPVATAAPTASPVEGLYAFPGPYEPIDFTHDEALQALVDETLGDRADSYAFFVKDLATGRGAMHNAEKVFNAASLFKLFVMYEVFRQESIGAIRWEDELVVTPYYDAFALSPRVTELCQVVTVAEAMDAMLSVSDNAAAVLLQDLARSGNVNSAIEALGLQQSGLFPEGLPVTAADLALLMEAIATGNAVSTEASADMLKLLDHDVFENGLVSGLPPGTVVSRKTGNWSDATNVAGVVYAPFGPYVFVALTSNGYETEVIRALSSAVYGYFEGISASR